MQEVIRAVRRPSCPGVEMIDVRASPREWGHFNQVYSLGLMRDWHGRVEYRRQQLELYPGDALLFEPGELFHSAPIDARAGSFHVLEISTEVFEGLCREEGARSTIRFREAVVRPSSELEASLAGMRDSLLRDAEPLEQQSRLALLVHAAARTMLEPAPHSTDHPVAVGPCELLRELLHSTEGARVSLTDFARRANVSQFQLIRSFKRRYGSPPHAYGLHVRVERARALLRRGFTVAEAAAATDFADQSHLTRHFRRIWGLTPGKYATGFCASPTDIRCSPKRAEPTAPSSGGRSERRAIAQR
jgi:AraC-like DNA-binding protein